MKQQAKSPITKHRPPTPGEVIAEQKRRAAGKVAATVPVKCTSIALAMPDNRTEVQRYVDEIAPASIVGRLIKFGKEGAFVTADDGETVPEAARFSSRCATKHCAGGLSLAATMTRHPNASWDCFTTTS